MNQKLQLQKQYLSCQLSINNSDTIQLYEKKRIQIQEYIKMLITQKDFQGKQQSSKTQTIYQSASMIIIFMSQQKAIHSQKYLESLQTLDNIFNYDQSIIFKLSFNETFCNNIRKYFINICKNYQEYLQQQNKQQCQKFQLYSVLYIIVTLIYHSESYKQDNNHLKQIPERIMNRTFIGSLLNLQICNQSKIRKFIQFLLIYIAKKLNGKYWAKNILKFIGNDLKFVNHKRTIINYVICLREISQYYTFSISEISKYNLIQKFRYILIHYQNSHSTYAILYMLLRMLKKHQILCKKFFNEQNLIIIGYPNIVQYNEAHFQLLSNLIRLSKDYCGLNDIKKLVKSNLLNWKINILSLSVVNILIESLCENDIIDIIQEGYLQQLKNIFTLKQQRFREKAMSILQKLLKLLSKHNWNFALNVYMKFKVIFYDQIIKYQFSQRIQKLQNIYETGFLKELLLFSIN